MRTRHKVLSKNTKLVEPRFVKQFVNEIAGAGDGTRTRDNLLGRQELYQTELPPLALHSSTAARTLAGSTG